MATITINKLKIILIEKFCKLCAINSTNHLILQPAQELGSVQPTSSKTLEA